MSDQRPKIIVLDDDPTGSQTVHSCLLLLRWDVETLRAGLRDEAPIFFILTNTRALTAEGAGAVTREVCRNLRAALEAEGGGDFLVVSRSDSTLRGHYPIETDVIAEELGDFDAHFLIPAFFEGGRVTRDGVHYLLVDGVPTPVHETEFARDSVFAYRSSYLPDYVEEKTRGKIRAADVERFSREDIHRGSRERLRGLTNNRCCVVDGEEQADLDRFAADLLAATAGGKRFLFRSAASILTSLAGGGAQPVAAAEMGRYRSGARGGAIVIGSHVRKTTGQLAELLKEPHTVGIEIEVSSLQERPSAREILLARILEKVNEIHQETRTPVLYTSREELTFDTASERLDFGKVVADFLTDIVKGLPEDIGFLVSKGGITSNDVLGKGLGLRSARLLGQILPGVSMVRTEADHPRFPGLPVVLFPGNVGDADGLATVFRRLDG